MKKCLIFSLLALILLGCGDSDSDSDEQSPQERITINAQDLLTFSPTKKTQVIDIRQKVTAENGQSLTIKEIENLDNNCSISNINGLMFDVHTNNPSVCRFKYKVGTTSAEYTGTSEAFIQVVATNDYTQGNFLPPISRTITESDSLTLDAKDLLIEAGFEIDPSSVYLTGETSSSDIGSVISVNVSSITYQAPTGTTGTVRIFYTEIDSINNIARPGITYIAIGQKDNHNPIAMDKTLEPLNLENINNTIDITKYISDQDKNDVIQLIRVKPFLGSIKIDSKHSFIYHPQSTGTEVLTYIISDNNGGYGIGILSFTVTPYESIIDDEQKLVFTPPFTMDELSKRQGTFTNQFQEIGVSGHTGVYPTFDQTLAEAYCTTKGMNLPSLSSLKLMKINVLKNQPIFFTKYHWHSSKKFLTADDKAISLADGAMESITDGYFSCTDNITPSSWAFLSPYYGAQYGVPTSVYLSAKTESGGTTFLPENKYNLEYKVDSMNVNGTLIDASHTDEYISISINGNDITVKKVAKDTNFAVNVTLTISDPIAKDSTTTLILGITTCPLDVTPPIADQLGCILVLNGKNNEKFTAPLSDNMLVTMGMDPKVLDTIGNMSLGMEQGDTHFKAIKWAADEVTNEDRSHWLTTIDNSCQAMNELKLEGRDNWRSGSTTVDPLEPEETHRTEFTLDSTEANAARGYVGWLYDIDHGQLGDGANYGLGFAQSDPTSELYVNQSSIGPRFDAQSNLETWYKKTVTYPTCWSKN